MQDTLFVQNKYVCISVEMYLKLMNCNVIKKNTVEMNKYWKRCKDSGYDQK